MQKITSFFKTKYFFIHALLAFSAMLLSFILISFILNVYTDTGGKVQAPSFLGNRFSILESKSFELIIYDSVFQVGVPAGTILDQNPKPGAWVKSGRKIYLTIASATPSKISLPRLIDLSLREAKAILESQKIKIGNIIYTFADCDNCIVDVKVNQESIREKTLIKIDDLVFLIVGKTKNSETIVIPNLNGLTLSEAKIILEENKLTYTPFFDKATDKQNPNAFVYQQNPQANMQVNKNTNIALFFSTDYKKLVIEDAE